MITKIFNTNYEFNNWSIPTNDVIVMPRQLRFDIDTIINSPYESGGVMLCTTSLFPVNSKICKFYLVEFPMIMNKPYSAFATGSYNREKLNLLQDLINKQDRTIEVIWFHSHVKSTGEYWYEKFSGGDYATFNKQSQEYMHVLFTPTSILTYSRKGMDFRFSKNTNDRVQSKYDTWLKIQLELHKI